MIVKRICQELRKPLFEVLQWPSSEIEWWSVCFSIDANKDKPIEKEQTAEESIAMVKKLFK